MNRHVVVGFYFVSGAFKGSCAGHVLR
jgi:hypothetical protein